MFEVVVRVQGHVQHQVHALYEHLAVALLLLELVACNFYERRYHFYKFVVVFTELRAQFHAVFFHGLYVQIVRFEEHLLDQRAFENVDVTLRAVCNRSKDLYYFVDRSVTRVHDSRRKDVVHVVDRKGPRGNILPAEVSRVRLGALK